MKNQRLEAAAIRRVVVQGVNWVGDAAMTLPALRRLRDILPSSHLTLATRSWTTGIFTDCDFVDDVMVEEAEKPNLRSLVKQVREWRRRKFDLAILLPNSFGAALPAKLAGVRTRVGYSTDSRGFLLSHPIPVPEWRAKRHEVFYYLNIIDALEDALFGRAARASYEPEAGIALSDERRNEARKLLAKHGVVNGQRLVAICPGSINSRAKRWPAERYAALADLFIEAGSSVMLIGSREEIDVSLEVQRKMARSPIVLTGRTDLSQVIGILGITDLLVTNDTGPAHISSAVGCPTLVIFGPTNPATTRPYSDLSDIVRIPPECAPCMLRDCPIDHRCMTAISPEDVFARASTLIKRARAGALVT